MTLFIQTQKQIIIEIDINDMFQSIFTTIISNTKIFKEKVGQDY